MYLLTYAKPNIITYDLFVSDVVISGTYVIISGDALYSNSYHSLATTLIGEVLSKFTVIKIKWPRIII